MPKQPAEHTCEQCGTVFMAKRSDARYCSATCRQRAKRGSQPREETASQPATGVGVADLEATLSQSAKERLEAAIRAHKRKLDREYEWEVQEQVTKELEEVLPTYVETEERHRAFNHQYKGVMSRDRYKKLRSLLHSDKYQGLSEAQTKRMDDMFHWLKEHEEVLCGMKEEYKRESTLPKTVEELMKRRKSRQRH